MPHQADQIAVPDCAYWRAQVRCQAACPVHTDARGYVRAVAEGNTELAYLIARGPNPLASICGYVCGAPCEAACRRGEQDEPVAIRALKRHVCDNFAPQPGADHASSLIELLKAAARRQAPRQCQGSDELLPLLQATTAGTIALADGQSVGIIGSGPAGLAAAHDLALLGFAVTIYEMEPVLAGMLAVGVPEYRLPRDLIRAEVEVIAAMGVKAVTNCCVGKDISFPELRRKHDAVVVAVGAKGSRPLPMPGADAEGVLGGVEFLRDVSLGRPPELGRRVVVIGGGNVAYDVGRTVLRQISMDAARSARRVLGVVEVYLCSLESLEEMPADDTEIIEGDEEGIIRRNALGPKEIIEVGGRIDRVRFQRCLQVFDEEKRFNPRFDPEDITEIPCDSVIIAIGQSSQLEFLDPELDDLKMTERGQIECNAETGETSATDVFVAGDLAYGPKLLIHAVASGKAVARSIYQRLTGRRLERHETELHLPLASYAREDDFEKRQRPVMPSLPAAERVQAQHRLVEQGFTPEQALYEASRCLDCGVNTIFDGSRCILCGGCADVCPKLCLRLAPADEVGGEGAAAAIAGRLGETPATAASVILKDETKCIRCALCAERCPTGAITMHRFFFKEEYSCRVG